MENGFEPYSWTPVEKHYKTSNKQLVIHSEQAVVAHACHGHRYFYLYPKGLMDIAHFTLSLSLSLHLSLCISLFFCVHLSLSLSLSASLSGSLFLCVHLSLTVILSASLSASLSLSLSLSLSHACNFSSHISLYIICFYLIVFHIIICCSFCYSTNAKSFLHLVCCLFNCFPQKCHSSFPT